MRPVECISRFLLITAILVYSSVLSADYLHGIGTEEPDLDMPWDRDGIVPCQWTAVLCMPFSLHALFLYLLQCAAAQETSLFFLLLVSGAIGEASNQASFLTLNTYNQSRCSKAVEFLAA